MSANTIVQNIKFTLKQLCEKNPVVFTVAVLLPVAFRCRGIEWSLRAFASMRAVRIFLRARAVINFVMRAASTLEITNGE